VKLEAFQQNVVSFVENQLKLTESATDKNLVKTCSVSSTKKASSDLPPNLTAHDRARKYLTGTFHVNNGLMFCLYYNIVIAHLRSPWMTSTLTQLYTSTLQTLTSEMFETWWRKSCS